MSEQYADLPLRRLCLDAGTQFRGALDDDQVAELLALLKSGQELDPIEVYFDGAAYYPTDGFHRIEVHRQAGRKAIRALVRRGTLREAILAAVGSNGRHGLARSPADKRRAVERLLLDPEWRQWNNREIARRCNVSEWLVRQVREDAICESTQMRTVARGGASYTMDVSGLTDRAFDRLSPEARLRVQQQVEERARRQREEEERRAAEAARERPTLERIVLMLGVDLVAAIDRAARRRRRDREGEILRALEAAYRPLRVKRRVTG